MNVLFVGLARTAWVFNVNLLSPGGMSLRGVIEELAKRYNFAKAPKNELDLDDQRSLAFKAGTFVGARKVPIVVGLNMYSDGWTADTMSSTDESTEFLNDVTKWLEQTYKLTIQRDSVNYLSQIDFQSDVPLMNLNPFLKSYVETIQERIGSKSQLDAAAIQFWTEDFGKPGAPAAFRIERKISAPFSTNHYFSQAPLQTRDHINSLKEFEERLKRG